MPRFAVDLDYTAEGWLTVEVEAENEKEARKLARKQADDELKSTSVLGPRHTPASVDLYITQVEPA